MAINATTSANRMHFDHANGLTGLNRAFTAAQAKEVAVTLNAEDDDWSYIPMEVTSSGICAVYVYDEDAIKVGIL